MPTGIPRSASAPAMLYAATNTPHSSIAPQRPTTRAITSVQNTNQRLERIKAKELALFNRIKASDNLASIAIITQQANNQNTRFDLLGNVITAMIRSEFIDENTRADFNRICASTEVLGERGQAYIETLVNNPRASDYINYSLALRFGIDSKCKAADEFFGISYGFLLTGKGS